MRQRKERSKEFVAFAGHKGNRIGGYSITSPSYQIVYSGNATSAYREEEAG